MGAGLVVHPLLTVVHPLPASLQVAFLQKMLTERGGGAAMAPPPPLPPPVGAQPSATASETHHIDMLLDGLSHTADLSLQRAADQAIQELDGSLHPGLHVMAEPEPEAYHVSARQRTGHGLPGEHRAAAAFGIATGADTDMLRSPGWSNG